MILRDYQAECLTRIQSSFASKQSTIAVLATGLGKTVIFSHLADRMNDRKVLIIAHREELVTQAADKVRQVCGETPGIEMGGLRADEHHFESMYSSSHVIVGSVQTLSRDKRRMRFRPTDFGLLIIDEAHHATGDSYRKVIDYFCEHTDCKLLGVTATPNRADETALGSVFDDCAFNYGIEDGIEDGWLCPIRQERVTVHGLDFSNVRTKCSDLDPAQLEKILVEEKSLHGIAGPTVELAGKRPTLVFCVSVQHAHLMAEIIKRYGGTAAAIDGTTDKQIRRDLIAQFKAGEIQYLTNCGIFLEGFDAPYTSFIAMARPTKSLPLYVQVLGRGTRPLPGIVDGLASAMERRSAIADSDKPFMTVLDFVGNSGRHKLITSADVLGGKYPEEEREEAVEDAEELDGDMALSLWAARMKRELGQDGFNAELARLEKEAKDEEYWFNRQRQEIIANEINYSSRNVDPFNCGDWSRAPSEGYSDRPSDKQVRYLCYLGVSEATARTYTKRQASAIIQKLKAKKAIA